MIANAVDGDKGWFTCVARNAAGTDQAKAYFFVTGKNNVLMTTRALMVMTIVMMTMMIMLTMVCK